MTQGPAPCHTFPCPLPVDGEDTGLQLTRLPSQQSVRWTPDSPEATRKVTWRRGLDAVTIPSSTSCTPQFTL